LFDGSGGVTVVVHPHHFPVIVPLRRGRERVHVVSVAGTEVVER
jgi:hypothetical protein